MAATPPNHDGSGSRNANCQAYGFFLGVVEAKNAEPILRMAPSAHVDTCLIHDLLTDEQFGCIPCTKNRSDAGIVRMFAQDSTGFCATKQNILYQLDTLKSFLDENTATLWVFVSTHMIFNSPKNGFLITEDAEAGNYPETALPLSVFLKAIEEAPARVKILFLDGCLTGTDPDTFKSLLPDNLAVICSTWPGKPSNHIGTSHGPQPNGPFASSLCRARATAGPPFHRLNLGDWIAETAILLRKWAQENKCQQALWTHIPDHLKDTFVGATCPSVFSIDSQEKNEFRRFFHDDC